VTPDASHRLLPGRRRTLVRIAARHFAAAGYDGASLNAVIRECRMSKSSFYYVIPSKLALFELVIADLTAAATDTIEIPPPDHFTGPSFWDRVAAFLEHLTETVTQLEELSLLGPLVHLGGLPVQARAVVEAWQRPVDAWIVSVLEQGRECGQVRSDLPTDLQARLLLDVLHSFDAWAVRDADPVRAAEVRPSAILALVRGMVGP